MVFNFLNWLLIIGRIYYWLVFYEQLSLLVHIAISQTSSINMCNNLNTVCYSINSSFTHLLSLCNNNEQNYFNTLYRSGKVRGEDVKHSSIDHIPTEKLYESPYSESGARCRRKYNEIFLNCSNLRLIAITKRSCSEKER